MQSTGTTSSVTVYLAGMVVISLTATLLLRDRTGVPLGAEAEPALGSPLMMGRS